MIVKVTTILDWIMIIVAFLLTHFLFLYSFNPIKTLYLFYANPALFGVILSSLPSFV